MHSERKEGLKDSEKFSDRNVTGENRWQKELASYLQITPTYLSRIRKEITFEK